jgi:hypothetical protein
VADEMVDWFNQVDAAHRSDLRELNELNFARFDVTLKQQLSEFSRVLDQRLAEFSRVFERELAKLAIELKDLRVELKDQQVVQMRWMIGMWVVVLVAVIGLWIRR